LSPVLDPADQFGAAAVTAKSWIDSQVLHFDDSLVQLRFEDNEPAKHRVLSHNVQAPAASLSDAFENIIVPEDLRAQLASLGDQAT